MGASDCDGFLLSKKKQTGRGGKVMSSAEKDMQSKMICISIWRMFLHENHLIVPQGEIPCMQTMAMLPYTKIEWSHIKERSTSPGLKYDVDNWQLLHPKAHRAQEGTEADMRPEGFKKWLKEVKLI